MKLKEYLKSHGVSSGWLARQLGISRQFLYMIFNETKPMPSKYWDKIDELTDGKISSEPNEKAKKCK